VKSVREEIAAGYVAYVAYWIHIVQLYRSGKHLCLYAHGVDYSVRCLYELEYKISWREREILNGGWVVVGKGGGMVYYSLKQSLENERYVRANM
jgi:hypothetical protein